MKNPFPRVSVVGLGYIGLPTAAILASHGVEIVGLEVSERAVKTVNEGHAHFVEPELDAVLQAVVASGKLRATLNAEPADAFLIAVPTPFKGEGHEPDISYIETAGRSIAPHLAKGNLVILESTSPVGTTLKLSVLLSSLRPDLTFPHQAGDSADVHVAHCPERVLPGRVLRELVENDRIIGGMSKACAVEAKALYQTFVRGQCLVTDAATAEMTKLVENASRDVNIAFANELSMVCDKLGINVWDVIAMANRHPRVNILQPGPGVGGHCIAVDPWFIVSSAPELTRLIRTAREVNQAKPLYVVGKIEAIAGKFKKPVIACLGLAFKADVDDLRESPSVEIVHELATRGIGHVLAVEPHVDELPKSLAGLDNVELAELKDISRADIVVLLVNHRFFQDIDRRLLAEKIVIDTRGMWR